MPYYSYDTGSFMAPLVPLCSAISYLTNSSFLVRYFIRSVSLLHGTFLDLASCGSAAARGWKQNQAIELVIERLYSPVLYSQSDSTTILVLKQQLLSAHWHGSARFS